MLEEPGQSVLALFCPYCRVTREELFVTKSDDGIHPRSTAQGNETSDHRDRDEREGYGDQGDGIGCRDPEEHVAKQARRREGARNSDGKPGEGQKQGFAQNHVGA